MIEIAICDDNENDQNDLKKCITKYMHKNSLSCSICTYQTGEELLKSEQTFHVVFLDIVMGEGMNGIVAGGKFQAFNRKTRIIYTTNFHDYIEEAINEVHAFAYIDKPVIEEKINIQLDEILRLLNEEQLQKQFITFEVIEIVKNYHIETTLKKFDVDDILYFEYVNRKIKIKTVDGVFYFRDQMKNLMNKMNEYHFESCHQSYLINLKYVIRLKGYNLVLKSGDKIPVSQKKSADFRDKMNKFIQKNL